MRLRFDAFVFDPESRELLRSGAGVRVSPKAFELLGLLLEQRPRALAKARIQGHLWPRTAVVEANLGNLVAELRQALGDDARAPVYIRTVYGFGYAFCGAVAPERRDPPRSTRCAFRLIFEEHEIPLGPGENVLGRSNEAVARIHSEGVSRRHARILVNDGEAVLEDLGSKNGTRLRGKRISSPTVLADGDEITLGGVVLSFRATAPEGKTQTLP